MRPTTAQLQNMRTYMTVRTLDSTSPGGDLILDSRLAWSTVSYLVDRPSATLACVSVPGGLIVAADGKVVCGANTVLRGTGIPRRGCPAIRPWRELGFVAHSATAGKPPEVQVLVGLRRRA